MRGWDYKSKETDNIKNNKEGKDAAAVLLKIFCGAFKNRSHTVRCFSSAQAVFAAY